MNKRNSSRYIPSIWDLKKVNLLEGIEGELIIKEFVNEVLREFGYIESTLSIYKERTVKIYDVENNGTFGTESVVDRLTYDRLRVKVESLYPSSLGLIKEVVPLLHQCSDSRFYVKLTKEIENEHKYWLSLNSDNLEKKCEEHRERGLFDEVDDSHYLASFLNKVFLKPNQLQSLIFNLIFIE